MSPTLNGSSAIRRFEGSDEIKIRDGITFDFYTGLPHMYSHIITFSWFLQSGKTEQHHVGQKERANYHTWDSLSLGILLPCFDDSNFRIDFKGVLCTK